MAKPMKLYDEAYVTGCDNTQEWMLPWFLKNFKKNNNKPLIFANFGITDLTMQIVRENVHAVMDLTNTEEKGWFKKPLSMLKSPSKKTVCKAEYTTQCSKIVIYEIGYVIDFKA